MSLEQKTSPSSKFLLTALIGLSPIPVAGEICLSIAYKDILENSLLSKWSIAIPLALMTRLALYNFLYIPAYNLAEKVIN